MGSSLSPDLPSQVAGGDSPGEEVQEGFLASLSCEHQEAALSGELPYKTAAVLSAPEARCLERQPLRLYCVLPAYASGSYRAQH